MKLDNLKYEFMSHSKKNGGLVSNAVYDVYRLTKLGDNIAMKQGCNVIVWQNIKYKYLFKSN